MTNLEQIQEALGAAATLLGYVGAVLVLALADLGMTLLVLRWAGKVKELAEPEPPSLTTPADHSPIIVGGALRRFE
jgi:hypothetical protein